MSSLVRASTPSEIAENIARIVCDIHTRPTREFLISRHSRLPDGKARVSRGSASRFEFDSVCSICRLTIVETSPRKREEMTTPSIVTPPTRNLVRDFLKSVGRSVVRTYIHTPIAKSFGARRMHGDDVATPRRRQRRQQRRRGARRDVNSGLDSRITVEE